MIFLKIGEINVTNYSRIENALEIYPDLIVQKNLTFIEFLKLSAKCSHNKDLLRETLKKDKRATLSITKDSTKNN